MLKKDKEKKLPTHVGEGIKEYLERIKAKYEKNIAEQAKEAAAEVHKEIGRTPEQQWLPFAPMPTDMCRVSPFFPLNRNQLRDRPAIKDMVITKSAWGQITYTGFKLSTYEEDALMAILALLDDPKNRAETVVDGKATYTYKGPLLPVLKLIGVKKGGGTNYSRIIDSFKLLLGAVVVLETKRTIDINNILTQARYDKEAKTLTVTVNPYFYETYIAGSVTRIDVEDRAKIKSPVAKCLHRFMQSHRDNEWTGHFLTLAATLNLDLEAPLFELRRTIRTAINALIKIDYLSKKSCLPKDIVTLDRNHGPKTNRRQLTE